MLTYNTLTRTTDIVVSFMALLVLLPIFLPVAVSIRVCSPGPVFYLGWRVGLRGRLFRVFKFRSMIVDAELRGGSATADDDPRLTPIGSLIRKYKIDELPQLINVLIGDMSLVGPRPEVEKYVAMYSGAERQILDVRPGITDWASLWNFDEGAVLAHSEDPEQTYERLIRPTKLRLQLLYVQNRSVRMNWEILFHTAMKLLLRNRWTPSLLSKYGTLPRYSAPPDGKERSSTPPSDTSGNSNMLSTCAGAEASRVSERPVANKVLRS